MAHLGPPVHLGKWRRTTRKLAPMAEDDDAALDTAMLQYDEEGHPSYKIVVPVRLDQQIQPGAGPSHTGPEPEHGPEPDDYPDNPPPTSDQSRPQYKRQWFYMKEFVSQVDSILQAMKIREALPTSGVCAECADSVGK